MKLKNDRYAECRNPCVSTEGDGKSRTPRKWKKARQEHGCGRSGHEVVHCVRGTRQGGQAGGVRGTRLQGQASRG